MPTREQIVAAARAWIGTPYRHQASLRGLGCDCLGLVRGVWRDLIGPEPCFVPPYSPDGAETLGQEALAEAAGRYLAALDPEQAGPGDVVLLRWRPHLPARHCAILSGPTTFIHAHDGAAVAEVAFAPWWRRRIAFCFAYPHLEETP
ncbi:peptidase P60 [Phreatobacter sp.]|uniref:peptidase P60 n=1 Tax=Phreatobacter sp. TaxID=1966341 RepID=UPI003F70D07F